MTENEKKLKVLKLAQDHQCEILENEGIISSLVYFEWESGWEYEVEYLNVHPEGETQLTFDADSLPDVV